MPDIAVCDRMIDYMLAPISDALSDPGVTDIVVNEPCRVGMRKGADWHWLSVPVFTFDYLDALTILIGRRTGREFDEANPYVNSTLPGGQRFQGVRPPGTKSDRILWAIRRPPTKARTMDDDDMDALFATTNKRQSRRASAETDITAFYRNRNWKGLLRAARLAGLNIALCGPTGSGKSDIARRLIQVYQPSARLVTIETDAEFGEIGPPNRAPLFYDDARMTADDAVRIALRLVPTEIAVQEIRGAEAYAMLRAMESGHNGITTWHAEEGRELEALCMMARQHPAGRELDEGRLIHMARSALDVIAYCERDDIGFRVASLRVLTTEMEAA